MKKLFFLFLNCISIIVFSQTLNHRFKDLSKIPIKIEAFTLAGVNIDENNTTIKARKHIYYLNSKGNFIRHESYKKNGNLSNWLVYKYDSNDKLIKVIYRYGDSSLNYINNYKYDNLGRLSKCIAYTNSDTLITDYSYSIKEDFLIRSKVMRKSGDSSIVHLDSNKNTLKSVYTLNGKLNGHVDYTYDKSNNLISIIRVNKEGETISYNESDFDEFGNIIENRIYSIQGKEKFLKDKIIHSTTYDEFNNPLKKYQRVLSTGFVYIETFKYFY